MPAGRPTIYNDEIVSKARDYLKNYLGEDEVFPSIAGLSVYLNVRA